jgi:NhaP-type Na+/H+ or K+/H+ antiporter
MVHTRDDSGISTTLVLNFLKNFVWTTVKSVGFGVLMGKPAIKQGGVSCVIHKYMKGLNKMPELEASLIFIMSLLTYSICELPELNLAAIVAIFVFGIMQSHYNRYNLSEESIEKAG